MKISFHIRNSIKKLTEIKSFEVPYEHQGHICNLIMHGDIENLSVIIICFDEVFEIPASKCWFFMSLSWHKYEGFEFSQYTASGIKNSLSPTTGFLRGRERIQFNNNLLSITFRPEANQDQGDLVKENIRDFLERCSKFGIKVSNLSVSEPRQLYKINCSGCDFEAIDFINSDLEGANFSEGNFNNVSFLNSHLANTDFSNSKFSNVHFLNANLKKAVFDKCKVFYNKQKIDNKEILTFTRSDLSQAKFLGSSLCSVIEESDLSGTDFSMALLLACKIYNCTLSETLFVKSQFSSFGSQTDSSQKHSINESELVGCYIGPLGVSSLKGESIPKTTIKNCRFDSASMQLVDLSNNKIINSTFESADLFKSKLRYCEFFQTDFHRKLLTGSANLAFADLYESIFSQQCTLNEVNFFRARLVNVKFNDCDLVKINFYESNLRGSSFVNCELIGADFRGVDMTMSTFNYCDLRGANFFRTQRGGLAHVGCTIKFIEWSAKRDGEIQISEKDFLQILAGEQSAFALMATLSKGNPSFISQIYNLNRAEAAAESVAESAGRDINKSFMDIDGDVSDSNLNAGSIKTNSYDPNEEDENMDSMNTSSQDNSNEDI